MVVVAAAAEAAVAAVVADTEDAGRSDVANIKGNRCTMRHAYTYIGIPIFVGALAFSFACLEMAPGVVSWAKAQSSQRTFATPEAGVEALIDAARKDDVAALESILGPGSREVVSSGDPVEDNAARDQFLADYDMKSNLVAVNDTTRTLQVGPTDWPLPIPLVRQGSMWRFDLAAGRDELINRRIGRNELNAIEAAQAFVDAQQDYASEDRDGDNILEYAQRFVSTPGMKDGLYWPTQAGEEESPLGPLFSEARAEGYQLERAGTGSGYYGYRYKILTSQGAAAMGGAYDYIVNGNMLAGVGLVAYPLQYGVSGIMSFIVNHDGVVYQKDLGPETGTVAQAMTAFNPDNTWQRVPTEIPVAAAP